MRRVPIPDPSEVGAHRPGSVAGRLTEDLQATVTHLQNLGGRMPSLDETLARLDNVVAAATQFKQTAEDDVASKVEERVAALEAALGITPTDSGQP